MACVCHGLCNPVPLPIALTCTLALPSQMIFHISKAENSHPIPESIPGPLCDFVRKCIAFEPVMRPASAQIPQMLDKLGSS